MKTLVTDQEGALVSDLCGTCCEKFDINLDLGGSQGHTTAPMAERRIQIIQLSALKLWSAAQKQGLPVTQEMCVSEAAMAANLMLTYAGHTPCQALFGYQPRELYDVENPGIAAHGGALETSPDFIEVALRLRLLAKDAILQSIVEERIARAEQRFAREA